MEWATKTKQSSTAQKSTDLGSWSPLAPWLNVVRGDQLSRTKWGAAKAYIVIGYVEKCVELIASGITSLPYSIKRFDRGLTGTDDKWTGTEIARSDDPIPQHPLFQLFHDYEDHQHMSFLFRVAASLTLFDELYIELVRRNESAEVSQYNPLLGLDWLNPLGMSINASNGRISQYFYSPFDTAKPATFAPCEVAYKHGYNPEDDLRGYPDVLAVLESLEIDFAIQTSVVSHFRNGIQGSALVSPKDGFGNLQVTREGMDDAKKRSRGPENVGGFLYWPRGVDVTRLDYPDYGQITTYSQETGDRILNQFGVPRAILGNSDIAGYKQGDETTYRFYVTNIIPRADDIATFFNRRIIPLLPPEYHLDRLVVDRSEFDRVSENDQREADIAGTNVNNTLSTINEGRVRQNLPEWPEENGNLLIIKTSSGTVFISPEDLKSGFVAGGAPEEAAVVGQTSDVDNGEGLGLLSDSGADGPSPTTSIEQINDDFESGLISFGQSMRLRGYEPPPDKAEIFDNLYSINGKLVPVDEIENLWRYDRLIAPSVTNAPLIDVGDLPGADELSKETEEELILQEDQQDSQKSNLVCVKAVMARSQPAIDNWDWSVEKAHKELDAWYTFIKRRGANGLKSLSTFEPNYTRGDIADTLIESFKGYNKSASGLTVKAIFGMVKDWVAVKSVQATRIDFEDDFEDTLQVHIDGNSTRRLASSRLRGIIRKANNKVFRDGLTDGGALGEKPTDAEQEQINQFISEQSQFVKSLLGTVKSGKLTSSQGKGAQWYNKSVKPMYDAGLASAGGNKMVEWVLGRTEVHCKSCSGYNGQRHRFKSWLRIGAMPQSDTLACTGHNCDCDLVPVIAKARGRLKLIKSIQELMKAQKAKPDERGDIDEKK